MVTIVRAPSQRQLRQVARTDDKTALLVCHIHQNLRALPRLTVLISDILHILILPDILKVLPY